MNARPPRDRIVCFRVSPATARLIQRCARADARSVSACLSFLVERTLGGSTPAPTIITENPAAGANVVER
jgi:hypothetical protein